MKLKKQKLFFILFLCSVSMPFISYADSTYKLTINNHLSVPIRYQLSDKTCINWVEQFRSSSNYTIDPKSSGEISFQDNNGGGCWNQEKKLTINIDALTNVIDSDKIYDLDIRWVHKNKAFSGGWSTIMYDITAGESDKKQLLLSNARCDGSNCLNTWASKGGPLVVDVSASNLASYQYILTSIQLGDVLVQDGFGGTILPDPISGAVDLKYDEKYYIKFSKSANTCTLIEGMIRCPASVDFLRRDKTVIFSCHQVEAGTPACPWTLIADKQGTEIVSLP